MNADRGQLRHQDRAYLRFDQYLDPRNLDARARLHRLYSTNQHGWHHWMFTFLSLKGRSRVLDCGCGPGHLWQEMAEDLPDDCQVYLMDLSEGMVAAACEQLGDHGSIAGCLVGDASSLPFQGESFDIVIAGHMLYHVPDRAKAISEASRVLKPAGCLVASTNGAQHLKELQELRELLLPERAGEMSDASAAFSLKNGEGQLRVAFDEISLYRFENHLLVTDAEDILAYLLSSSEARESAQAERLQEAREFLLRTIRSEGAFRVAVDSGLFLARRPRSLG